MLPQTEADRAVAWCLEKMAEIALSTAQHDPIPGNDRAYRQAAQLFGAADGLRTPVNSKIDLVDQPDYERQVALVREHLDEATFTAEWRSRQAMSLRQAVAFALADRGSGE